MNSIEHRKPRVAVLLAAYNGERYIKEQLETISSQKNVEVTLFISIDKSSDQTLDVIRSLKLDISVEILKYGERFGSAGKNFFRLIRETNFSGFDFIAFADQDDIWLENKLSCAISKLKETGADGYSSNVTAFWDNGKRRTVKKDYEQVAYDYLFESPGPGCTFVLKNNLAIAIQNQIRDCANTESLPWMHDWYIYSFSRYNRYRWVIDSKELMLYRQHENNEVGANSGLVSLFNRLKIILAGDGLDKVVQQASFIGQSDLMPIKLLQDRSALSFLRLTFYSFKLRRKLSHKLFLIPLFICLSLKGVVKA